MVSCYPTVPGMSSSKYLWKQAHPKKCINNCFRLKEDDDVSHARDIALKCSCGELSRKIQSWLFAPLKPEEHGSSEQADRSIILLSISIDILLPII